MSDQVKLANYQFSSHLTPFFSQELKLYRTIRWTIPNLNFLQPRGTPKQSELFVLDFDDNETTW